MKTRPIVPARIDFSDAAAPSAPDFGDIYHSRAGALAQSRHVFLGGNGLPGRWAGRERFVILETGFGLGNNFLATWDAWRQDAVRCERLVFISIEKHPLRLDDLRRAHQASGLSELAEQLAAAWPPLTPNLHRLEFENGHVQLLLCLGDVHAWMRELVAEVDAFYLDGFAPAQNPEMWDGHVLKALGRRAAPDATLASWSVAPAVREAVAAAGFTMERQRGFANKGGMCVARHQPHHVAQRPAGREPLAPHARHALVLGSGLAGAACAWALAQQDIRSVVIDARPHIAGGSSGNPGGLFHGTLNPDDGTHARFNRAAALETERALRRLPALPWLQPGLLRLELERSPVQMQALLDNLALPAAYVRALTAAQADALSGLDLRRPAWFYPGGGALPPPAYVAAMLTAAQAKLQMNTHIARLSREGEQWQAWTAEGKLIGEAPLVVLAGGHEGLRLLQGLTPDLPLTRQRGQLSHIARGEPLPLLPVAGLGYALADGAGGLWCGATNQDEDLDDTLRDSDHAHNLAQWSRLAHRPAPTGPIAGRVAWRLTAPDRLPVVGGLPMNDFDGRNDQPRFIPRVPGLAVCTAFGSRGITWAALCGQVLASQVTGAPCPIEASLLDAIDPSRFSVRTQRKEPREDPSSRLKGCQ